MFESRSWRENLLISECRVADADRELLEAKLERTRLAREVSEARSLFEAARQEWEEALALKRRLETRPYVQVVSEPTLPEPAGVAPEDAQLGAGRGARQYGRRLWSLVHPVVESTGCL